jgi:hypothetical protein
MSETRKVNWKNVSIVLGVGILGTIVGIADRIINYVRPIEDVYLFLSTSTSIVGNAATAPDAVNWYNTSASLATTLDSGFGVFGLLILAIIAGAALSMTVGFCSLGGRG